MAISDKDITIRVRVDNTGAVQVLDETGEKIKGLGDKSQQSSQEVESLSERIGKAALVAVAAKVSFDGLIGVVTRAGQVQEVSSIFENLVGSVGASEKALKQFSETAGGVISNMELMQVANKGLQAGLSTEQFDSLVGSATKLADVMGVSDVEAIELLTKSLAKGNAMLLETVGVQLDVESAQLEFAESIGTTVEKLTEEQKLLAFRTKALQELEEKTSKLTGVNGTLNDALDRVTASAKNIFDEFAKGIGQSESITQLLNEVANGFDVIAQKADSAGKFVANFFGALASGKGLLNGEALSQAIFESAKNDPFVFKVGDYGKKLDEALKAPKKTAGELKEEMGALKEAQEAAAKAADEWYQSAIDQGNELQKLVENTDEYKDILADLENGSISSYDASQRLLLLYSDKGKAAKELAIAEVQLAEALSAVGDGANATGDDILKLNEKIASLKKELGDGKNGTTGTGGGNLLGNFLGFDSNVQLPPIQFDFEGAGKIREDLNFILQTAQSGSIEQAITAVAAKALASLEKVGQSTKDTISGIFGAFFPVNFGLGDKLGEIFSSKNAGAIARDKVDAFFEDALDANRTSLVINGQLQEIKDIAENNITGMFEELDKTTAEGSFLAGAFGGIGLALEEQFGVAGDISGQIGAILYNNVGGSLNNLQILFEELGISQEDLGAAIEEAWLDGNVSAQEFLATTSQINNLYQKGIPDGVGRTDLAFQNLIDSAGAGRQVVDALQDSAIEAQEAGITTLEGLKEQLLASGADAQKVEQAFNAIANAGITSLDQLASVSVSTAATISSQLESAGNFFTDIGANLENIQQQLDQIRDKEVNIKFNVSTNVDANTEKYVGNTGLPNATSEGVQ
jgi:hypothetical protein